MTIFGRKALSKSRTLPSSVKSASARVNGVASPCSRAQKSRPNWPAAPRTAYLADFDIGPISSAVGQDSNPV